MRVKPKPSKPKEAVKPPQQTRLPFKELAPGILTVEKEHAGQAEGRRQRKNNLEWSETIVLPAEKERVERAGQEEPGGKILEWSEMDAWKKVNFVVGVAHCLGGGALMCLAGATHSLALFFNAVMVTVIGAALARLAQAPVEEEGDLDV